MTTKKDLTVEMIDDGWICTDASSGQFCRKINDTTFEYKSQNAHETIDLNDYTDEEKRSYISSYYDSMEDLFDLYGSDSNMIVAECIFEEEFMGY